MSNPNNWNALASTVRFSAPFDLSAFQEQVSTGARILDLGCGYGRIAADLQKIGFTNLVGYDSSEALIKRGRNEFPNLDLRIADASCIPEPNEAFQTVISVGLFTSIPESDKRIAVVREIERLLTEKGMVFGVDFLRRDEMTYTEDGRFKTVSGVEMKHFYIDEIRGIFSGFSYWQYRIVPATSLTGSAIEAIQYTARYQRV